MAAKRKCPKNFLEEKKQVRTYTKALRMRNQNGKFLNCEK
jgi:hypothetical protein